MACLATIGAHVRNVVDCMDCSYKTEHGACSVLYLKSECREQQSKLFQVEWLHWIRIKLKIVGFSCIH